eukprot:5805766-Alexandrium_andersonii.AAC.1
MEPPRSGARPSGRPRGRKSPPLPGSASRPGRGNSCTVSFMNGLRRRLPRGARCGVTSRQPSC